MMKMTENNLARTVVVIPIGDIAGVGPEIVVKALNYPEVWQWCIPIVVGEKSAIERAIEITGTNPALHPILKASEAKGSFGTIDMIDMKNVDGAAITFGKVQKEAGRAAFEFIEQAVKMLKNNEADAIATTTINKEALKAAGVPYIGHTEIIGGLLNVADPMTMFQVRNLKVFFLSRHLSLQDAISYVTTDHVHSYIHRTHQAMQSLGVEKPRIAIAGLNPHSGEHGLFGSEEVRFVTPAVEKAQADGINITGPIGADSVFHLALKGAFDAVISLYHDQGHIATKMVDFERTISVTVGLPCIRTSVDHGTAFDIAGKNLVSEISMYEAIRLAAKYAKTYKPFAARKISYEGEMDCAGRSTVIPNFRNY